MRLRRATLADLETLRGWDAQPHIIESKGDEDWGWEAELARDPSWRQQLVAEADGRPVGFIQIIDPAREDSHYWGDCERELRAIDIWIGDAGDLGRGLGTRMMELALERCFAAEDVSAVVIDPLASNARAHRFYERLGFAFIERRRFGADDCAVFRLDRARYLPRGAWRSARVGDDQAIGALFVELTREDPGPHAPPPDNMRRTLAAFRADPARGRPIVLDIEGQVAGYAILVPFWSTELGGLVCVVDEVYVAATARGRGHASRLIELLADGGLPWAADAVALSLEVSPANRRARSLYERLGFQPTNQAMILWRA